MKIDAIGISVSASVMNTFEYQDYVFNLLEHAGPGFSSTIRTLTRIASHRAGPAGIDCELLKLFGVPPAGHSDHHLYQ